MLIFSLGKAMLTLLWAMALLAVLLPRGVPGSDLIIKVALITLAIHLIELVFVNGRLRTLPKPWYQRLQVLLFGYFYWGKLGKLPAQAESE